MTDFWHNLSRNFFSDLLLLFGLLGGFTALLVLFLGGFFVWRLFVSPTRKSLSIQVTVHVKIIKIMKQGTPTVINFVI